MDYPVLWGLAQTDSELFLQLFGLSRAEILGLEENPFIPDTAVNMPALGYLETIASIFNKIYRGMFPKMIVDPEFTPEAFFVNTCSHILEILSNAL